MTRKSLFAAPPLTITPKWLIATVTTSLLVACGGGGGGGSTASSTSRAINDANQKQVVAAALRSIELGGSASNSKSDSDESSTLMPKRAARSAPAARALQPVAGACSSGRLLIDDVTGEEVYQNCEWTLNGQTLRFNGSLLTEDLRGDATSDYDTRVSYNNYSFEVVLSGVDHITNTFNGVVLDSYSETGGRGEADLRFDATFVCKGVSGSYGGEFQLSTVIEQVGNESSYTENGEISFNGVTAFNGTLTVTTVDALRYRDDYNDSNPYAGRVRFAANDGSAVEIVFAEGGLYVDGQFFTWEQYDAQFFVNDALAPCFTP